MRTFATKQNGSLRAGVIQTKLPVNNPGDKFEQEAGRRADEVVLNGRPLVSAQSDNGSNAGTAAGAHSGGENALEPGERQFFESRFDHNFADVRVHTDPEANKSAAALEARAFTVGNQISFAQGEYQPGTTRGRHLIAHELSHVIQQRGIGEPDSPVIQRQPKDEPAKSTQQPKPKPRSTLKKEGVDVKDPVAGKTPQIIDAVLQRNQKLAPYIGGRLQKGFKIAEKGKFVLEVTDGNFDDAYRGAYDLASSTTVSKDTLGFYDPDTSEIHLRPNTEFGTALHESMHKLAAKDLYVFLSTAQEVSENFMEVIKEGLTAYFTDIVLQEEGLTNYIDAYSRLKKQAGELVTGLGSNGFDLMANFNFVSAGGGLVKIGNELGLSTQEFANLKGKGQKEVFKRMNKLL